MKKDLRQRVQNIAETVVELKQEVFLNEQETEGLINSFKHLEFVLDQTKRPLKIALKCLNFRDEKVDIEKLKDLVQKFLRKEVDCIREYQGKLKILMQLMEIQIFDTREKHAILVKEIRKKEIAQDIDQKCHVLTEKSMDLNKFEGIELVEPDASVPDTWKTDYVRIIKESSLARDGCAQLVLDADAIIQEVKRDLLDNWIRTNEEFKIRVSEIVKMMTKLRYNAYNHNC